MKYKNTKYKINKIYNNEIDNNNSIQNVEDTRNQIITKIMNYNGCNNYKTKSYNFNTDWEQLDSVNIEGAVNVYTLGYKSWTIELAKIPLKLIPFISFNVICDTEIYGRTNSYFEYGSIEEDIVYDMKLNIFFRTYPYNSIYKVRLLVCIYNPEFVSS